MPSGGAHIAVVAAIAIWLPLAACVGGPPHLRAGLWEIRGQSLDSPGAKRSDFSYKLCRDHAYDAATDTETKDAPGCTTVTKTLGGGRYASASTCTLGGITVISNGVSTYKGASSVHSETQAAYSPPLRGKTQQTLTQDQQFLGSCPAAMQPGDRIEADGLIRHHG